MLLYINNAYKYIIVCQMSYALEEVARILKAARHARGLSQRALSAKTGLTQAHISKIENAGVDITLSNLIELARALDLEVTLVPSKTVPAVQSIIQNVQPLASTTDALKAIRAIQDAGKRLSETLPDTREIQRIQNIVREIQNLRLGFEEIAQLQKVAKQARSIYKSIQPINIPKFHLPQEKLKQIKDLARQLQEIRNTIAHAIPSEAISRTLPAYRLDEDDG
ncbi:MAG: helix-turn-helix transcriptional regulator [Rhodospirillales bacterium]|nr:helix-turn-helix transcriptional regulator [Rhodospirillales bacterium]